MARAASQQRARGQLAVVHRIMAGLAGGSLLAGGLLASGLPSAGMQAAAGAPAGAGSAQAAAARIAAAGSQAAQASSAQHVASRAMRIAAARPGTVRSGLAHSVAPRATTVPMAAGHSLAARAAAAHPMTVRSATARAAATGGPGRTTPGPGHVSARAADLVRALSGKQLWSRGLTTSMPIGSLTKIMTALVVLDQGNLGKRITVTHSAVAYVRKHDGSSAELIAGDVLTGRQLLEALLLPSGCDAAFLLERAYAPSAKVFVEHMNAEAAAMGMTGTRFSNADGLPLPTEHSTYSTPADLIVMARTAMNLPLIRTIVRQRVFKLAASSAPTIPRHAYRWKNTNLLLGSYPGTIGIKTGTTLAAGDCLLFEARRNGVTLIGVVLHAGGTSAARRYTMAARMLDWGFGTVTPAWRAPRVPAWAVAGDS